MLKIGLFGTCGNSTWRESFVEKYEELGISYYNPQVENRDPSHLKEEAQNLARDKIILLPITGDTYSLGSLSELGFNILNAISLDNRRSFVVMVDNKLAITLNDRTIREESFRVRALVSEHLRNLRLDNLYIVYSLEDMLEVSIELYRAAEITTPLEKYTPHK